MAKEAEITDFYNVKAMPLVETIIEEMSIGIRPK